MFDKIPEDEMQIHAFLAITICAIVACLLTRKSKKEEK